MKRIQVLLLLLLATIIAVEPLLHEHPLQQWQEAIVCAACAAGTGQVAVARPVVVAPSVASFDLAVTTCAGHSYESPLPLPSRAPPAL